MKLPRMEFLVLITVISTWLSLSVYSAILLFQNSKNDLPKPDYNVGTPAYDLSMLTDSKEMYIQHNQYVSVIGVDVMNLWLQNATNKRIISIVAFDRGIQGTTSSFLIVYSYY